MEISRRTHKSGGDDRPHTQGEWTQKGIGDDNKDNDKAHAKEVTAPAMQPSDQFLP